MFDELKEVKYFNPKKNTFFLQNTSGGCASVQITGYTEKVSLDIVRTIYFGSIPRGSYFYQK